MPLKLLMSLTNTTSSFLSVREDVVNSKDALARRELEKLSKPKENITKRFNFMLFFYPNYQNSNNYKGLQP
jgi:hypothetical protein